MPYTAPTAYDVKVRYPAFVTVADDTVELWLAEAATECANWPADARARAEILYAAHKLTETGAVAGVAVPAGLTQFKSGDFSAQVADVVAARTGFDATVYGREYRALMRRYFSGPRSSWTAPCV